MLAYQIASGGYVEPIMYRICVRGRISEQRVAMTVDNLAALITAEPIATNWRKPNEASSISTIAC
jgi:hypothetical protein